jgi:hypothetical protein
MWNPESARKFKVPMRSSDILEASQEQAGLRCQERLKNS